MRLDPQRCAVVVVDVQNDFCHPDGVQGQRGRDLSGVGPAVERLGALVDGARDNGVPVVFVRTLHDDSTDTANWLARNGGEARPQTCHPGTWGADFYQLQPIPGADVVVTKSRYSAFIGTTLQQVLTRLGRDALLLAGVSTAVCVETTLRDAVCRDYLATLVEDCCSAYGAEPHDRAIAAVTGGFGLVLSSHEVLGHWSDAGLAH